MLEMTGEKQESLFNSFDQPIPPVRYDIQQIPIQQNGEELLYFYDSLSYCTSDFTLPADSQSILSLLDGNRSIDDLIGLSHGEVSKNDLLNYVRYLDEHGILHSENFKQLSKNIETDYEQSGYHISNTAGISFPNTPTQLIQYLNKAFNRFEQTEPTHARALLLHISIRELGFRLL